MSEFDLFLTPAMECIAFEHGLTGPPTIGGEPIGDFYDDYCHFCYPFNLTGQPAISVPMGIAELDLPVGLQIVGRRFDDELVLRAAAAWERSSPWPRAPTPSEPAPAAGYLAGLEQSSGSVRVDPREASVAAGQRITLPSETIEIRRALSPRDGELVVEYERR
jgi:hypothetical protein